MGAQRCRVVSLALIGLWSALAVADELPDAGVDAPANAEPPQQETQVPPVEVDSPPAHAKKHKKHDNAAPPTEPGAKPKKKRKKLELTGRIFTRAALVKLESANDATMQTTLQSARAGLDYRGKHGLRAQLELEVATKAQVKDAYVQLRLADEVRVDVRAGNFKMPFSAIQLESIWSLPMADRGLVDNILTKRMQVAGRAVGAMIAVDLGGPHHPRLRGGVFQGRNDAGDLLNAPARDGFGQDAVLRASVRPARGVELGASGSVRAGSLIKVPIVIEHGYAGEVDIVLDVSAGPGRVRAWAEAMIGTSWLVGGALPGHDRTRFLEGRAIAAYRLGGTAKRGRYVEIYALGAGVDPDRIIQSDRVTEVAAGITYGAYDVWRVQLEGEAWRFGANSPLGIAELAVASTDSTTLLVQLGAHL